MRKPFKNAWTAGAVVVSTGIMISIAGDAPTAQSSGPSSSQSPYVLPSMNAVQTTSILTVGDAFGAYRMAGIPDGLGAFDNGDGTFTLLMNHEIGNSLGVVRDHGSKGAFVSRWVINKTTLAVVSGSD